MYVCMCVRMYTQGTSTFESCHVTHPLAADCTFFFMLNLRNASLSPGEGGVAPIINYNIIIISEEKKQS